jgi:copper(I)-binding protein
MRSLFVLLLALAAILPALGCGGTSVAEAAEAPIRVAMMADSVVATDAWVRAGIDPTAAYTTLVNNGETEATLTDVLSSDARTAMIHRSTERAGLQIMEHIAESSIPPGGTLTLAPGGLHIMLQQLEQPLIEGETVSVYLEFSDGSHLPVTAAARTK